MLQPRLDKRVLTMGTVDTLSENGPPDDQAYWATRTPAERVAAVEALRRINYGNHRTSARLQRVLEFAEFPRR